MAIFGVTFRISDQRTRNGSRQERYKSFVDQVKSASIDYVWEETSSFILIKNETDSASTLARAFQTKSSFDSNVDLAVVIDLSRKAHLVIGRSEDHDIEAMMELR